MVETSQETQPRFSSCNSRKSKCKNCKKNVNQRKFELSLVHM